jgi:hypothetical protein
MRAQLTWLANAIGGFCAGFVVWVSAGTLAGRAIVAWHGLGLNTWERCWPFNSPILLRLHLETDSAADLILFAAVAVPSVLVEFPALVVRLALTKIWPELAVDPICFIVDDWLVTFAPALFVLLSVTGLVFWYDRAQLFAVLLFLALVTEIVAIAVFG